MSVQQEVYFMFAREVEPLVKAKYPGIQKDQFNQVQNESPANFEPNQ